MNITYKKKVFENNSNSWKRKDDTMDTLKKIALVLVIIGALNWLLVGLFEMDLVATIFGSATNILSRIVYVIIGVCGLITISYLVDR